MSFILNPYRYAAPAGLTGFVFTVRTTTSPETIAFTGQFVATYNADIDWGDGTTHTTVTAYNDVMSHEYATAGDYDIVITGTWGGLRTVGQSAATNIIEVKNWGDVGWTNADSAFYGCTNMTTISATDGDNLSNVTTMASMFRNTDLASWTTFSTASCIDMSNMFRGSESTSFANVAGFDITSLTNAANMFLGSGTMNTTDYDALLVGWEAQTENSGVTLHAGTATQYSSGAPATARAALVANSWSITDGGEVP